MMTDPLDCFTGVTYANPRNVWLTPHPVPLPQGERERLLNGHGLLPLPSAGEGWGEGAFAITNGNIEVIKFRETPTALFGIVMNAGVLKHPRYSAKGAVSE